MDPHGAQKRIDAVEWYHDFDFGGGLVARSKAADADDHRRLWRFIEGRLDTIDFVGRTVLDVGCWDGYWSFYAERRGASAVLASDDATQNWSGSRGLLLAKELLGSRVETKLDLSVYDLTTLGRTFDVVLCLGVYYHLHAPFYALAQLRHCCHAKTVLAIEGNELLGAPPHASVEALRTPGTKYTPSAEALRDALEAAYFRVESEGALDPVKPAREVPLGWRWRLGACGRALRGEAERLRTDVARVAPPRTRRILWLCRPFEGVNDLHTYRPPFGLDRYDGRWRSAAA